MELGLSRTTELLTPAGASAISGIYETFRADAGSTPFLDRHIMRMHSGIISLGGHWSLDVTELTALASQTLAADYSWAKRIRIDAKISPTNDVHLSITGFELTGYGSPLDSTPVSIVTRIADRDIDEAEWSLKSSDNSENRSLRAEANAAGYFEGVFISSEGRVYEGAFSNIFIVRDGGLTTPGTELVLPGITRQLVAELAAADGMNFDDRGLTVSELIHADEAFITSSIVGLVPIGSVVHGAENHSIGDDKDRTVTSKLSHLYQSLRTSGTS